MHDNFLDFLGMDEAGSNHSAILYQPAVLYKTIFTPYLLLWVFSP